MPSAILRWMLFFAVLAAPLSAEAGRRPFIWAWDTEIIPQGDVELEQWLWVRSRNQTGAKSDYWIWWGPVIGISNHLEVALPFQVQAGRGFTWLESFEADFRYRLFNRNDDGPFQVLFRGAYHQAIHSPVEPVRFELDTVFSYGQPDELHATLDLGLRIRTPFLSNQDRPVDVAGWYAAGVSMPVTSELRVAVEYFGESGLLPGTTTKSHQFIGPGVSWTRGKLWATLGVLVGLTPLFPDTPQFMPRLIWAVVL